MRILLPGALLIDGHERIGSYGVTAALRGITATVVGAVLNLATWLSMTVPFTDRDTGTLDRRIGRS